jgi:RNA 3'-phosphate cyclase
MPLSPFVRIDGSYGEGGGTLVRTALIVSVLTQQPVEIENVRSNLKYPGVDIEDLTLIRALARMTGTEVSNVGLGDRVLRLHPNARARGLNGRIGGERNAQNRAASVPITMTSLIPALCRTGTYSTVTMEGETFGHNSLGYDAFLNSTLSVFREMGIYAFPTIERAGFGRDSDGDVTMDVEPSPILGLQWNERGRLNGLYGRISLANVGGSVAERAMAHASRLAQNSGLNLSMSVETYEASSPGFHVTFWADYDRGRATGSAMGSKGLRAEAVVQDAFDQIAHWMSQSGTVDPYLADQIIVPAAFAESGSVFRVSELTPRFLTAAWVIKQFLPLRITVRGSEGGPGLVTIEK